MTEPQSQTHELYRLLDRHHEVLEQAEWPNDAEALRWAEKHRSPTGGPAVRRVERQEGDRWVYVSEAGASAQDRGPDDA